MQYGMAVLAADESPGARLAMRRCGFTGF